MERTIQIERHNAAQLKSFSSSLRLKEVRNASCNQKEFEVFQSFTSLECTPRPSSYIPACP